MKLNFKSISLQKDKPVNIEFTTELTREFVEEYDVLTFVEPSRKVANRLEISKNRINIFAGATTLILIHKEWFENPFFVSKDGTTEEVKFFTYLNELDYDEKQQKYTIKYDLASSKNYENLIGSFTISLEIS